MSSSYDGSRFIVEFREAKEDQPFGPSWNFMHESLYRVLKVSKRARKYRKKPQIWFKMHFSKKHLSWLI